MLLQCRDLQRLSEPDGNPLLHATTLGLRAGDRRALVGKSGAGKSLLLRGLSCLDPRTTGTVQLRGQTADAWGIPQFRRHVVYLTQHSTLMSGTVEDNFRIPFQLASRQGESFDRNAVVKQLHGLGRDETFLEKPVTELSGGESRIVVILRGLQLHANVLLLDEPTSSLDEETAQVVEQLIGDWMSAEEDRAYVWVTHSMEQARRVSDHVWEMKKGQLIDKPFDT